MQKTLQLPLKFFAQVPILRMTSLKSWYVTEPDIRQRTRK